jgi:hypothetical protein
MKKFVKWFILGTLIIWLVVDIILDAKGGPTISRVVMDATGYYGVPIIGVTFFVLGHIFWPQKREGG